MSIRVTHRGIINAPILVTPKGRSQTQPVPPKPKGPDLTQPMGLYEGSQHSELRLSIRKTEQARVLKEARQKIQNLSTRLKQLDLPQTGNILLEKSATSPKPRVLSLQADRDATTPATHTLEVHWPAVGRDIQAKPQNPVAEISLADGEHEFSMVIDGQEQTLSVNVNKTLGNVDSQADFLERLSREISVQDSRVKAEVVYGETDAYDPAPNSQPMDRTATLRVYSTDEGEGVEFYFQDVDGGSLVSHYGLDQALPQRSAFLNQEGASRQQSTNQISLDEGHVTGEALGNTGGPLDVPVKHSPDVVPGELNQLISQYNDLVNYLASHGDLLRPSLLDRVTRPTQERARELPQAGLQTNAKGALNPGPDFETRVQYDYAQVREILLDDEGWTGSLSTKLDQILALEEDAFALPLSGADQFEERRRAWALVQSMGQGVISSYT